MARDCADGKLKADDIDEAVFESYLDTHGIPDPDLMIRTSGEQRLSNYLLCDLPIRNSILQMFHGRILRKKSWRKQ